jgi:creatinine amidohydrolase/Fe(II)-dependent formamide hydrolase-like protein
MGPADLAEAVEERPIAWLVVSPFEWHGEALAFGGDPHVAQTVADLAREKTGDRSRFGVVERDRRSRSCGSFICPQGEQSAD